jgi:hypothetical protein
MRPSERGFPVSSTQGVGNRETAPEPLISNDLPFPGAVPDETPSGKPKSTAPVQVPLVHVQRHFQPGDVALDQLVEALYRLLMDVPSTESTVAGTRPEPACFPGAPE